MHRLSLAVAAAALLAACVQQEKSAAVTDDDAAMAFANDDEKVLYAIGVALGENVTQFKLTDDELEFVNAGIHDAATKTTARVDMDVYGPKIQELLDRRMQGDVAAEKEASAKFADEVAAEPGAERTDSGLVYVPISEGDGAMPKASDVVRVHYTGSLRDGTVFDSSVDRGQPVTFPLNGVIPCWTEGVQRIHVGGKAKLLCPSDIAYGDSGRPPQIPGGAALLFEVELLGIEDSEDGSDAQQ